MQAPPQAPRRVRVSASTSNLGPGFDLAGLALNLFLEVEWRCETNTSSPRVERGEGCEAWPDGASNRLWIAFTQAAARRHIDVRGSVLRAKSAIPIGRGLGSSAAATVAGVLLADALCARAATREELLLECVALEGHPDNATPALHGGFTLSFLAHGRAVVIESEIHPSLGFAIAWPDAQLETERARRLLPESVAFADAVENPRRLAALLEGMRRGERTLIALGSEDRLHERYRLPCITGGAQALQAARTAGAFAAMISGSGSGLFAICARGDEARIADAMVRGFSAGGARAVGSAAEVVRTPPRVDQLLG